MDALKETRGIYKPIRVLFSTPVYERALKTCWHLPSYKTNIAIVTELLRLQQENLLPPEVTAEDMTNLLLEQGKNFLKVQLWEFEIEDRDEEVVKPLLKLVWDVINSLKMRDVVFEARRLIVSPHTIPSCFQHPKLLSLAQTYARTLAQLKQDAPKRPQLREVVMEVVPQVIHGLWLPPASSSLNMPSQQLSTVAVGLTQSVLDRVSKTLPTMLQHVFFSRSVRDQMVQIVLEKVLQMYPGNSLEARQNCFSIDLLRNITSVTAEEICKLFEPQTEPDIDPEPGTELDSGCAASPLPLFDEPAEPLSPGPPPAAHIQPTADSAAPLSPVQVEVQTLGLPSPTALECITTEPVTGEKVLISAVKNQNMSALCRFFRWLQRIYSSYFLPEEDIEKMRDLM